ncbi:MAG: SH3 domain-containing protein [Caulobacteraceae bacterium]
MKGALALIAAAFVLVACGQNGQRETCPAPAKVSPVTGFCVPRWVSLKSGDVDGRKGPGEDYPALFVYHVRGLPVQVVGETSEWRRICDPDGGVVWVHRSMIDGRRTVMAGAGAPVGMRKSPGPTAPLAGLLNARALASVIRCQAAWCKVKAGGRSGWVEASAVWGAATGQVCR